MSWVLSLDRSGGTAGSHGGHETRRHRVRGPFPMGACLLLAGTLALAGCGSSSSSSSSTVTINPQQPDPQQPDPQQSEPELQTGGGSGEGEGDGGQGAGGGAPPTDTTTTEDGDGDTDSGDTTSTGDGGQTVTQQPQQPPQQPSNQQPPQTGGGTGGNQGSGNQGSGNQGSGGSGGGTGGGGGGGTPAPPPTATATIGVDVSALQAAISSHTTSSTPNLPAGLALARDSARESEIDSLLAGLPEGSLPEEPYSVRTEITKSGSPLKYEMPKERLRAWLGGVDTSLPPSFWEGRIYRGDGSSWGVVYQNLPKKYTFSPPTLYWNNFFSTGGQGNTDNTSLTLDQDTGKLTWDIGGSGKGADKRNTAAQISISLSGLTTDTFYHSFGAEAHILPGNHKGTFYGVPGTFSCQGSTDPQVGDICRTLATGGIGWAINEATSFTFTPDDGPSAFGGQIEGESPGPKRPPHFHFGYWLNAPENDGGAWSIEPFAVANFYEDPISDLSTLSGTAKYSGPATGVYAVPDQLGHKGVTGTFYAHAVLTATWGGSWPTVKGTVGNFQSLTEDQHLTYIRDWSLTLEGPGTQGSGPGSPNLGNWHHSFWGQDPADSNAPTAITGTFTGYFTNGILSGSVNAEGSVVGAFVAEKVPE